MSHALAFPNRPQHHDFVRLSAVVIEADDQSDAGAKLDATMDGLVDIDSLIYMAEQRVLRATMAAPGLRSLTRDTQRLLAALYIDAFRAGVRFEQEGGHSA